MTGEIPSTQSCTAQKTKVPHSLEWHDSTITEIGAVQVPDQPWYMKPVFSCLVGGILPFGAVFIELFFILTSIWLHKFYYIFGFLTLVFAILIVTCMEITIVLCYFQLCSEDYRCVLPTLDGRAGQFSTAGRKFVWVSPDPT